MSVGSVLWCVRVIIRAQDRPQGFWRRIMKVFRLLPYSILTMICETTFDASLAWSFITCIAY